MLICRTAASESCTRSTSFLDSLSRRVLETWLARCSQLLDFYPSPSSLLSFLQIHFAASEEIASTFQKADGLVVPSSTEEWHGASEICVYF